MKRENTIRIARDAGLPLALIADTGILTWDQLEAFGDSVAEAVRQRAILQCIAQSESWRMEAEWCDTTSAVNLIRSDAASACAAIIKKGD